MLDVGCAEGFFCFEVERLGARKIVGYEKKIERYREALRIKAETGSDAEFVLDDIGNAFSSRADQYNIVLLLNVLHHLTNPIDILRRCLSLATECVIVEYATPDDPKFIELLGGSRRATRRLSSLPIIGVSSLPRADQTFLFTDAALEQMVTDHEKLASRVDFAPSPINSRRIAYLWT